MCYLSFPQVVEKLDQQHKLWEKRLEREKQKVKEDRKRTSTDPLVLEMEERNSIQNAKRQAKIFERKQRAQQEVEQKKEQEMDKWKKMINAKAPVWKLTKTAEDRAKLVRLTHMHIYNRVI